MRSFRPVCLAAALLLAVGARADVPDRRSLLASAETSLQRGDPSSAIVDLELAALLSHAADTEMRLVRARLQLGDYRGALAFGAHAAGAHRDTPAAAALYAWLLAAGGQGGFAQRVLDEAAATAGNDEVFAATRAAISRGVAGAYPVLLEPPQRMAPYARVLGARAPDPRASIVSSGTLLSGGRQAVVPLAAVEGADVLWVRNGLGTTTAATIEHRFESDGIAVLKLAVALDEVDVTAAKQDPFAGSPGHVVGYAASGDGSAAWPRLHAGFFGTVLRDEARPRPLGIAADDVLPGGPVFDAAGRWAGIATRSADGHALLLPIMRLRAVVGFAGTGEPAPRATDRPLPGSSTDAIYERALRSALQVLRVTGN